MACHPVPASNRQGFNRRWFAANLDAYGVPRSTAEARATLEQYLASYGRDVRIASGRHCYEDFVYGRATRAVVDTTAMGAVGYDARYGYFVEAGASNWDAYRRLLVPHNVTLPAGSCYSVGAGGHITGGGYGLLSRLRGLTVDHLTGVEIICQPAGARRPEVVTVSAGSADPDERALFWALRGGGGGNFGLITRYFFETLPAAPARAAIVVFATPWTDSAGRVTFTRDHLQALLDWWAAEMASQAPSAWSEFGLLKLNHLAAGEIAFTVQIAGEDGEGHAGFEERARARLRAIQDGIAGIVPIRAPVAPVIGHPVHLGAVTPAAHFGDGFTGSVQHLTYLEALQTLNGSGPNQFGKYKSAYMRKPFPADQVAAIHHWLQVTPDGVTTADMAQSLLQVDTYGGRINRVAPDATAIPQRSSIMKLQYQTYWNNAAPVGTDDPVQERAHLSWIRDFYAAVYAATGGTPDPDRDPTGTVGGCYVNYPDSDLGTWADGGIGRALHLYYLGNLERLQRVKAHWDPNDFFNNAQSIGTPIGPPG